MGRKLTEAGGDLPSIQFKSEEWVCPQVPERKARELLVGPRGRFSNFSMDPGPTGSNSGAAVVGVNGDVSPTIRAGIPRSFSHCRQRQHTKEKRTRQQGRL